MSYRTADVTAVQRERGIGIQPLLAFLCGHKGKHEGASFRANGTSHGRLPWRCAACTEQGKAVKALLAETAALAAEAAK